jgi:hypothetical protein
VHFDDKVVKWVIADSQTAKDTVLALLAKRMLKHHELRKFVGGAKGVRRINQQFGRTPTTRREPCVCAEAALEKLSNMDERYLDIIRTAVRN